MFLHELMCNVGRSVEFNLSDFGLPEGTVIHVDPRGNFPRHGRFDIVNDGNGTVTVTRLPDDLSMYAGDEARDPDSGFCTLRVYLKGEPFYHFNLTRYLYHGLEGEFVPLETTELFIHQPVQVIRGLACIRCHRIRVCLMQGTAVHTIGDAAFGECWALKMVRFSQGLRVIGNNAFHRCLSLEALILPPRIESIGSDAFFQCLNIRILPLPRNIDVAHLGRYALGECETFFQITQIQERYGGVEGTNSAAVHQSILDFYDNFLPLNRVCLGSAVTAETINRCIALYGPAAAFITDHDGMNPLHILAMNPNADEDAIEACFNANMNAAIVRDSRGNTPLDYMLQYYEIEGFIKVLVRLIENRYQE